MNEEERYDFYAGCALIGILSHHGTIDMATAIAAHDMASYMEQARKLLEKQNDDK